MGIEPTSSAWKAEVIAVIPHPRILHNYLVGAGDGNRTHVISLEG